MNSRIKILPPEEARRIAAGEVIDRPAALVREFLDNAIDAGAENIEISVNEGGCKKIEVSDDGCGMDREDLAICWHTHATSKIRSLDDLETAATLGFRGEALAAAAAVSRLEIISSKNGRQAYRIETGPGENYPPEIEQCRRTKGTTVRSHNLFENIPARKRFLKREGSEGTLCRQAFLDKALAFNIINFRFIQDGKLKDFFPGVPSRKERFAAALLQTGESTFLHEINVTGSGFSAAIVIGGPELHRNDRRQMFVFANGRRVNDYSLIQAMDYGAQGWFPNGTHPVGAVFVEIDPALADFNIHPAKREVRFRDPGAIHQAVSGGLRNFFHSYYLKTSRRGAEAQRSFSEEFSRGGAETLSWDFQKPSRGGAEAQRSFSEEFSRGGAENAEFAEKEKHEQNLSRSGAETLREFTENFSRGGAENAETQRKESYSEISFYTQNHTQQQCNIKNNVNQLLDSIRNNISNENTSAPPRLCVNSFSNEPRYAGRVFGLFILIEWGDKLYIIDQHAAHERILYNRFMSQPIPKQQLLAPIPFTTESNDEDAFLEAKREELSRLGIDIEKDEVSAGTSRGSWRIEALPADWRIGDAQTVKEILELRTAGENMAERWAATLCCRAAIKDGDYPDDETAFALGRQALALSEPRCPHGRPIWTEISREALFKAVRRT